MSELIAPGTSQTTYTDITVLAGSPRALFIKPNGVSSPAPFGVDFELAHKGPAGNYHAIATLNASNINQCGLIVAPGTYGVRRLASSTSAGMDIEG